MPITSQIKGYPFEVVADEKQMHGAILCDQIRSLDWQARHAKFVTQLSKTLMEQVLAKLKVLID